MKQAKERLGMAKYGMPYMGSKSKVIEKLIKHFPNAENFYDLFGGGGAVSHCVSLSGKYRNVFYNELQPHIAKCFKDAIDGKYSYENFKPKWIIREEFFEKKGTDGYISTCWSFGSRGCCYLFGKSIEQEKRSMHQAVVFDEFDQWFIDTFKIDALPMKGITERRLYLKKRIKELYPNCGERYMVNGKSLKQLQQLEQLHLLERLQRLQRLQQLEQLEQLERARIFVSALDYRNVEIPPNSIVYCDIPYKGTAKYQSGDFDHDTFYEWASSQAFPIFISEYKIEDDRFFLIDEIAVKSTLSATSNSTKAVERLYCNKAALGMSLAA